MYYTFKRVFDIVVFGVILVPLLIPIMIGLKFTGEGYIWYKQEQIGYKNIPFLIWKFATILKESSNMSGYHYHKKESKNYTYGWFFEKK